ncbi:hypothetical protein ACEWPL_016205 [Roseovarius sp. S1116L3]|uniref:hypothetical protein n=1 Tax=Roseovarius roseus TaxID=3342636 RepID=UPI00372A8534
MLMLLVLVPLLGADVAMAAGNDLCRQRNCDIGLDLESCESRQVCDMIRDICVPECIGADCCQNVACPEGSACVPWRGSCGIPAGPACFDLGSSWWTGSGNPLTSAQANTKGSVDFIVRNRTGAPLYFEITSAQPRIPFTLYTEMCGRRKMLDLPENKFCPNWCPASGPVQQVDCRKPGPAVFRLGDQDTVRLTWSGSEMVATYRSCRDSNIQVCDTAKPSSAGLYFVEICAHSERTGGAKPSEEMNPILGATVVGSENCMMKELEYPAQSEIEFVFAK